MLVINLVIQLALSVYSVPTRLKDIFESNCYPTAFARPPGRSPEGVDGLPPALPPKQLSRKTLSQIIQAHSQQSLLDNHLNEMYDVPVNTDKTTVSPHFTHILSLSRPNLPHLIFERRLHNVVPILCSALTDSGFLSSAQDVVVVVRCGVAWIERLVLVIAPPRISSAKSQCCSVSAWGRESCMCACRVIVWGDHVITLCISSPS